MQCRLNVISPPPHFFEKSPLRLRRDNLGNYGMFF
jgi:hypothetical protein